MAQPAETGSKPLKALGLVWIDGPYSVMTLGLEQALAKQAQVHVGREAPEGVPSSIILCAGRVEDLSESVKRVQEVNPRASILVFGLNVDLPLARAAFRMGTRGFIHAEMTPDQVARAVTVAANGEPVAPRELLLHLVAHEEPVDLNILSARQREILKLVVDGLSNAEIAGRLYLSESTVKQHLRATYKLLGVKNRTEAARLIRNSP
ncbi:MAG: response regulator transcription factor [Actinomycetota bacterium]|jgi:DNA-binding NarL/FixJ family response regulator|nr:response regulator transcription factor [Actinomycetota bacterium]